MEKMDVNVNETVYNTGTPIAHTHTHICMATHNEYHPTETPRHVSTCNSAIITDGTKTNASHKQTYERYQRERKKNIDSF